MNKYQKALELLKEYQIGEELNIVDKLNYNARLGKIIDLFQELVDKVTPKKVLYLTIVDTPDNTYLNGNCPNCHYIVDSTNMVEKYCQYCGQALDWSKE